MNWPCRSLKIKEVSASGKGPRQRSAAESAGTTRTIPVRSAGRRSILHVQSGPIVGEGRPEPIESAGEKARLARHRRQLGRLYPVLAHDLRAYLNAMVLNLELLQRTAGKGPIDVDAADRIRRYAEKIGEELGPLDRMLKAVVGQMRLSEPPTTRFDLRAVGEDLALVFDSYARSRRVRLHTTLADVPMPVVGDRDSVDQALFSLLLDLIDAQPAGSCLSLTLQSARGQATLTIAEDPVDGASRGGALAAAAARGLLEPHGATVAAGPDGSASLEISFPLLPQST